MLVRGVVQGVGFRPFVYRLAQEEGLSGSVGNDTNGVTIEVEGPTERVEAFLVRLRSEAPPMARIDSITVRPISATGAASFQITVSELTGQVSTGIPADAATCPDCLRELFDPQDRRFLYPFLNCTNCGPRFTITRRIPYDRPQTSMADFPMCPECQREYDDPLNRRFHAQPNACYKCGPHVWLITPDGETCKATSSVAPHLQQVLLSAAGRKKINSENAAASSFAVVERTIDLLLDGRIVAIKGIGGFHLCVDATNESAVMRLRERKRRWENRSPSWCATSRPRVRFAR